MKKALVLLVFLFSCLVGHAQTPPVGYTAVTGSSLTDSSGNTVGNATISFAPVSATGAALSFRAGGSAHGQVISVPVTAKVVNGAFSVMLADTSLTFPSNVCYNVTVIDDVTGSSLLGAGYTCVQAYSGASWCTTASGGSGASCNFDNYTPNLAPLALVQTGPMGPAGPAGTGAGGIATATVHQIPVYDTSGIALKGSTATVDDSGNAAANLFCANGTKMGSINPACPQYAGTADITGGTVDASPAINAAIVASGQAKTKVILPAGNYLLMSPLVMTSNEFVSLQFDVGPDLEGAGPAAVNLWPCYTAAGLGLDKFHAGVILADGNGLQSIVTISGTTMTVSSGNPFKLPVYNVNVWIQKQGLSNWQLVQVSTTSVVSTVNNGSGGSTVTFVSGDPIGTFGQGQNAWINGVAGHLSGSGTNNVGGITGTYTFDQALGSLSGATLASGSGTVLHSTSQMTLASGAPGDGTYTIIWEQPYLATANGPKIKNLRIDGLGAFKSGNTSCPGNIISNQSLSEANNGLSGIILNGTRGSEIDNVSVQSMGADGVYFPTDDPLYRASALTSNGAGPDSFTNELPDISHTVLQYNGGWGINDDNGFGFSYPVLSHSTVNSNAKGGIKTAATQFHAESNGVSLNGCTPSGSIGTGNGYVSVSSGLVTILSGTAASSLANNQWISIGGVIGQIESLNTTAHTFTLTIPAGAMFATLPDSASVPWKPSCRISQEIGYSYAMPGGGYYFWRGNPSTVNTSPFSATQGWINSTECDSNFSYCIWASAGDNIGSRNNQCISHKSSLGLQGVGEVPHACFVDGFGKYGSGAITRNRVSDQDRSRSDTTNTTNSGVQTGTLTVTDTSGDVAFVFGPGNAMLHMSVGAPFWIDDVNGNSHRYLVSSLPTAGTTQGTCSWTTPSGTTLSVTLAGGAFASVVNNQVISCNGYLMTALTTQTTGVYTSTSYQSGTPSSGSGNWALVVGQVKIDQGGSLPAVNTVAANWGYSLDWNVAPILLSNLAISSHYTQMEDSAASGNLIPVSICGGAVVSARLAATGGTVQSYFIDNGGFCERPFTYPNFNGSLELTAGANPTFTLDGTGSTSTMTVGQPIWITVTGTSTQFHIASIADGTHGTLIENGTALSGADYVYSPPGQPTFDVVEGGSTNQATGIFQMCQGASGSWGWICGVIPTNAGTGYTSDPIVIVNDIPYPRLNNNDNYVKMNPPSTASNPNVSGQSQNGSTLTQGPTDLHCFGYPTSSSQPSGQQACIQSDNARGLLINDGSGSGNSIPLLTVGGPVFDITHYYANPNNTDTVNCTDITAANTAASAWAGPAILYVPLGVFRTTCAVTLGNNVSVRSVGQLYLTTSGASSFIRTGFGTGNTWGATYPTYITGPGSFGCNACNAIINIKQFAQGTVLEDFGYYGVGANGTSLLIGDVIDTGVLASSGMTIRNVTAAPSTGGATNSIGIQVESPVTGVTGIGNFVSGAQFGILDNSGGNVWIANTVQDPNMVKCFYDKNTTTGVFSKYTANVCNNPSQYAFHALGNGSIVENNQWNCTAAPCVDNTETAMFFNSTDPLAAISGNTVHGGSSSSRWQFDTNLLSSNMTSSDWWNPGPSTNVATTRIASLLAHQAPTASGLTSINSQTGPAITITGAGSVSVTQSANTITVTGAGGSIAPTVVSNGGDLVCAMAGDTTIASTVVTSGSSTSSTMTFGMSAVPVAIQVGSIIGAAGNTPSGFNAATGLVVTARTSSSVTVTGTANPGTMTGFGTIFLACSNQTTDSILGTAQNMALNTYTIPASYFSSGTPLRSTSRLTFWTPSTTATFFYWLRKNSTLLYGNKSAVAMAGSFAGYPGTIEVTISGLSSTQVNADPETFILPYSTTTPYFVGSGVQQPVTISSNSESLVASAFWTATRVASITSASGGTVTGSIGQTCNLGTFNNSSTATAVATLTAANTIAGATFAIVGGTAATAAPTSATLTSGTATCSGTATLVTTLGGAAGNAVLQRTFEVRPY